MSSHPLEARIGGLEARMSHIEGAFEQVSDRLGGIERRLDSIDSRVESRFVSMDQRFALMDQLGCRHYPRNVDHHNIGDSLSSLSRFRRPHRIGRATTSSTFS
jgi:hypothetical protein